jgi:glycosyltransferase involved in cell wall biosynthesis
MIYFSCRTRKALADGLAALPLGYAHYSYTHVCRRFVRMLSANGIPTRELVMPEIYNSYRAIQDPTSSHPPIHLIFKPYEEIRLLKGAINVAHVFWEFDRLPNFKRLPQAHPKRKSILNDYVHDLSIVDEIWVGCNFTKRVFEAEGLSNVFVMPAPIEMVANGVRRSSNTVPYLADEQASAIQYIECTRDRIAGVIEFGNNSSSLDSLLFRIAARKVAGGKSFLAVLNPGDCRKNAASLMAGFQRFCEKHDGRHLLIIKLVIDGVHETLSTVVSETLPARFHEGNLDFDYIDCENIVLVSGAFSEAEMSRLYGAFDFYLCASHAEGQNLPVLEAMSHGVVPISPATTAMEDYIADANAIVLKASECPIHMNSAEAYGLFDTRWQEISINATTNGIAEALNLSKEEYEEKQSKCILTIRDCYSVEAVAALAKYRFEALSSAICKDPIYASS